MDSDQDEADQLVDDFLVYRDVSIILRNYQEVDISENSKYIQICEKDGTIKNVLKSSIVWLLSNPVEKLSADRLKRVQSTSTHEIEAKRAKNSARASCSASIKPANEQSGLPSEAIFETIHIGEWCIFLLDNILKSNLLDQFPEENEYFPNVLFGLVLGFEFNYAKSQTKRKFVMRIYL